ncbi:hypothetical protein [uncultured Peptoniphilus sp.]|uniref:hypothetical protein n=1 Tax=uncultured Peptoniphilus sp. TaxID=254354 RepID=UPI0025D4E64E|nr:hypothetical protein [uncultured Peptoniphilus sp.]
MKKIIGLLLVLILIPGVTLAKDDQTIQNSANLEVVETIIVEENENKFIKQDILKDGTIVESGAILIPKIQLYDYSGGSWDSGTCYSNVRGLYVYKEIDGNRIQFTADVALVDPICGNTSRILRGYDITLNRKRGGYFTTTSPAQYTAYHSGYKVSLYVSDGRMWTD